MKIQFYNVKDENEVVKKELGNPIMIGESDHLDFKIKRPTNMMNLELIFATAPQIEIANYCHITGSKSLVSDKFDKYYYIIDKEFLNGSLVKLILKEDVLKTYENEILNSVTFIERSQTLGNEWLQDTMYPTSTKRKIFFNSLGSFEGTLKNYLVVTNGGDNS